MAPSRRLSSWCGCGRYGQIDSNLDIETACVPGDDEVTLEGHGGHKNFSLRDLFGGTPESNFALSISCVAALNSSLLGYDVSIMSAALVNIRKELELGDAQEELVSGTLNMAGVLGALLTGWGMNAYGRKRTIVLTCAVAAIGSFMSALSVGVNSLLFGRAVLGIAVGGVLVVVPVYIAEVVPLRMRGCLVSLSETFLSVGIFAGFLAGWAIGSLPIGCKWRVMVGAGTVPAALNTIFILALPESPRWLLRRYGREVAQRLFAQSGAPAVLVREILDPKAEELEAEEAAGWREVLRPSPALRRILVAGLGVGLLQQLTGIEAAMYYTPVILDRAGLRSESVQLVLTLGMGVMKLGATIGAGAVIDIVGRRPMLICGSLSIAACYLLMSLSYSAGWVLSCVIGLYAFVGFFAMSLGPVGWVTVAEVFPMRIRAQSASLSVAMNRAASAACVLCFLSVADACGIAGLFAILAAINVLSAIFVLALLPETKGKSLEEIELMFAGTTGSMAETVAD